MGPIWFIFIRIVSEIGQLICWCRLPSQWNPGSATGCVFVPWLSGLSINNNGVVLVCSELCYWTFSGRVFLVFFSVHVLWIFSVHVLYLFSVHVLCLFSVHVLCLFSGHVCCLFSRTCWSRATYLLTVVFVRLLVCLFVDRLFLQEINTRCAHKTDFKY